MYKLKTAKKFDTQYKKLSHKDKKLTFDIIQKLLKNETLDERYKDHKLKGKFQASYKA